MGADAGAGADPGRLFAALEERAREERGRIEAETVERVSIIMAAASQEVERIGTQARHVLRRELAVEGKRLLGEARLQASLERLRVKRALLSEVFQRAEADIERLKAGQGYAQALDALAAEASASVGEPCGLEVRAEDAFVVAASADGKRRADNGLATRLAAARVVVEPEVARILFGARGGAHPGAPAGDGSA